MPPSLDHLTPTADRHLLEATLLHHGGSPGQWGSLGLWPAKDYASACISLVHHVARAIPLPTRARILSPGCGAGEELRHWCQHHGAAEVIGLDSARTPTAILNLPPGVRLITGDAMALSAHCGGGFDAVLCVDAAYHFSPRVDWLQQVHRVLKPGGWLAYTDLTLRHIGFPTAAVRWALGPVARAAGIDVVDLLPVTANLQRLREQGFEQQRAETLDRAVLDGFAAFVHEQGPRLGPALRSPGWHRVAATARALPWARRLGLGYALFCARRPATNGG